MYCPQGMLLHFGWPLVQCSGIPCGCQGRVWAAGQGSRMPGHAVGARQVQLNKRGQRSLHRWPAYPCRSIFPGHLPPADQRESRVGGFGLLLDSQFCRTVFCPLHVHKPAFLRNDLFELLVTVSVIGIIGSELCCSLEERLLHFL